MVLAIRVKGASQGTVAVGEGLAQLLFQVLQDRPNIRLKVVLRAWTYTQLGLQAKLT